MAVISHRGNPGEEVGAGVSGTKKNRIEVGGGGGERRRARKRRTLLEEEDDSLSLSLVS